MTPKWSGLLKPVKVVSRIHILDTSDIGRVTYLIKLANTHPLLKINATMGNLADDIKKSNNIDQMIALSEETSPAKHRAYFFRNNFDLLVPKSEK